MRFLKQYILVFFLLGIKMKTTTLAIITLMATMTVPGKIQAMIEHTKTAAPEIVGIEPGRLNSSY